MKVAHVLNELRHSGAEIMIASAAKQLLAAGPCLIISTGAEVGDFAPTLEAAGYEIVHKPRMRTPNYFSALGRFLLDEEVDVVHLHTEASALAYSLMAWRYGIPAVRTIHNEFRFDGLLRRRRMVTRKAAALLGTVHVACSPSVQENERERFGLQTELVNNWLDPTRVPAPSDAARAAARDALGLSAGTLAAISIANEAPAKNLAELFRGVALASAQGVHIRLYHCGVIGADLIRLAEDAPACSIVALGTVDIISSHLSASDVFLSTSFNEGGQISLLEASAAGLSCITTKVGLAHALDQQPGVTFIDPTAEALAGALRAESARSRAQRRLDGQKLSDWARSYFVPERGASEYLRLYERQLYMNDLAKGRRWAA